jgi:hypothetical protein
MRMFKAMMLLPLRIFLILSEPAYTLSGYMIIS